VRIAAVCGSFHKAEVEQMLEHARDEATSKNAEVTEAVWVPGSMEALNLSLVKGTTHRSDSHDSTPIRRIVSTTA
jgi:6,7-dimethyl-8-ribityllumazine synthase